MSLIIFSHANSFPAGCYNILFRSLRGHGHTVKAIDKLGHDPQYPVTSNWPHMVQQIADFAQNEVAKFGKPAYLVGHSLGGFLSLMVAAQHPKLARGVVMLDSPVLGGWRAKTLELAKSTTLIGALGPGKISKQRRNSWDSAEAALAHFASKKAFALWQPKVLQDYIDRRQRHWAQRPVSSYLFVSSRGNRLDYGATHRTFYALSRQIGLRADGDHHGPRLHDMRHRFATNTLVNWYRSNQDPQRLLPILSAYLGHVHVEDTQWYLNGCPELMSEAMRRVEHLWETRP